MEGTGTSTKPSKSRFDALLEDKYVHTKSSSDPESWSTTLTHSGMNVATSGDSIWQKRVGVQDAGTGIIHGQICPKGHYCPNPYKMIPCPKGMYCPKGSYIPRACPSGYYCPEIPHTHIQDYHRPHNSTETPGVLDVSGIWGTKKVKCRPGDKCIEYSISDPLGMTLTTAEKRDHARRIKDPAGLGALEKCRRGYKRPPDSPYSPQLWGTKEIKCGPVSGSLQPSQEPQVTVRNKYQDEIGQTSCKTCPEGINSDNDRKFCLGCPAGHECPNNDTNNPLRCPPGKYVPKTSLCCADQQTSAALDNCPKTSCLGSIGIDPKQYPSQCIPCPIGQYQDSNESTQCKSCPKGTYQDQVGQTACLGCENGTYQDNEGGAKCKKCKPGHFCASCADQTTRRGCNEQGCEWDAAGHKCISLPPLMFGVRGTDSDDRRGGRKSRSRAKASRARSGTIPLGRVISGLGHSDFVKTTSSPTPGPQLSASPTLSPTQSPTQ